MHKNPRPKRRTKAAAAALPACIEAVWHYHDQLAVVQLYWTPTLRLYTTPATHGLKAMIDGEPVRFIIPFGGRLEIGVAR
jgi:hypothetical protein